VLARCAVAPLLALTLLSSAASAAPPVADPWLGRDKLAHFGASAVIAGIGYGASMIGTNDLRLRIAFGVGAGVLVGGAKEMVDMAGFGDPSWKDFTWDIAGTVVGVGIALSLDLAIHALRPRSAVAR
jgi:putative lipoprotein